MNVSTSSDRSLRNAAMFGIAAALQRALTFLLLPLFTHVMSTAEYGRLGLVQSIVSAGAILFSFGLEFALFRNFFQLSDDPAGQRRLVDSTWTFLIATALMCACIISAAVAPQLSETGAVRPTEFVLALISAALVVSATTLPLALLRAQQRLREYLLLNAVLALVTAAATIALVVGLRTGVRGWLLAVLLANLVTLLAAMRIVPWHRPDPFDRRLVKLALVLGLPLVPHFLAHWALQLADRVLLAGMVTTTKLGVYTLAATLALPTLVLVQALNQGFMPAYASAAFDEGDRAQLPALVTLQLVIVLVVGLLASLLGPLMVGLAAPPAYAGAAPLIPWIVLGYVFVGLYGVPMNALSLGMGRTQFVWIATTIAAATNILLILVLVPAHGLEAAAVASAIGYFVLLSGIAWQSRGPLNPVRYEWAKILPAFTVIGLVYAAAVLTTGDAGLMAALGRLAWCGIAAAALVTLGTVPIRRPRRFFTDRTPL